MVSTPQATFDVVLQTSGIELLYVEMYSPLEVEGTGYPVIVNETGTNNLFLAISCQYDGYDGAMTIIANQPLNFFVAWKGIQMMKKLKRVQMCRGEPATLNALTTALLRQKRRGLIGSLASDWDMDFSDFVEYLHRWRGLSPSYGELMELARARGL